MALVTATRSSTPEDRGFLPLTVEYREKAYAAGRIPGNFFKREGRPGEKEVFNARLTDHQLRPLFPKGFPYELQVYISIISSDGENDADVIGMVGASAALCISDIPFAGPVAAVRVGRVDGEYVINPTHAQMEESDIELIMSGNDESIMTVEGSSYEISEAELLEALKFGHGYIRQLVELQNELVKLVGREKLEFEPRAVDPELVAAVEELAAERTAAANRTPVKEDRAGLLNDLRAEVREALAERFPEGDDDIKGALEGLVKKDMRRMILDEKQRIDGRSLTEVRNIDCETTLLPRAHGSALFTRGQTQALCVATLGMQPDERMLDDLRGKHFKTFYLDYNFPSYSVGEVRRITGPGRREIGHGLLAERALEPVLPDTDSFPYTLRVVAEITESNSSSSMASVCGGSLALMDAGVPIKAAVCGAGVGLVMEGDEWELLTDIQGAEDHLGDMDFKVAGTEEGITAFQMDIKIHGISFEIMEQALERSREGRLHILGHMNDALAAHRPELSQHAPQIQTIKIDPSKIGAVIGPGGKMIRSLEEGGAKINIEEDGTITVGGVDGDAVRQAMAGIEGITADAEVGRIYQGKVISIKPFGAFVEILPGKEGLLHISELAPRRVEKVEDVIEEGQTIAVKVLEIDNSGKMRLSHKATLQK